MKRTSLLAASAVLALVALTTTPAASGAAGAAHFFLPEDYDAVEAFDAGDGPCVDWAGTFHEVRHGGYDIVVAPGGQVEGEIHINGAVAGYVELVPADPGRPTYSGSYREKVNAVLIGTDAEGNDVLRVARYGLRTVLRGSDGSQLTLSLSGHLTINAQGRTVVTRDRATCT